MILLRRISFRPIIDMKFDCAYARVAIKEAFIKFSCGAKSNFSDRKKYFDGIFYGVDRFKVDDRTWEVYSKRIIAKLERWPAENKEEKEEYLHVVSSKEWSSKLDSEKDKHSLNDCKECATTHKKCSKWFTDCSGRKNGKFIQVL